MNLQWATCAMNAGGTIKVEQMMTGKGYFRASMSWPDEPTIHGEISLSIEHTLESLETALRQDVEENHKELYAAKEKAIALYGSK